MLRFSPNKVLFLSVVGSWNGWLRYTRLRIKPVETLPSPPLLLQTPAPPPAPLSPFSLLSSAAAASSVCQTLASHSRSSPKRERSRAQGGAAASLTPGQSSDGCPRACTEAMTPQLPSSSLWQCRGGHLDLIRPRAMRRPPGLDPA